MKYGNLFVSSEFPERLSNKETLVLFNRMKQGDMEAREELISGNIDLVIQCVNNGFKDVYYDKKELVSIGCLELIKAVDAFDMSRGTVFSMYAFKCIINAINKFLKKIKNDSCALSFDDLLCDYDDDLSINSENMVLSELDIEEEYIEREYGKIELNLLRQSIDCLSEHNREILKFYFGFYNNKRYTCCELAKMMNTSRSQISIIVRNSLKKIKIYMQLLENGMDAVISSKIQDAERIESQKKDSKPKKTEKIKATKKRLPTIYELFGNYHKENIDEVISKLSDEDRELLRARYGNDLDNPVSTINYEQRCKFYGSLVPRIRHLLEKISSNENIEKDYISNNSLFIKDVLFKELTKNEILTLLNRLRHGDMEAREELITKNIGLVIQRVKNNFMDVCYDKKELVAVGCLGLVKAVDTCDGTLDARYFLMHARKFINDEINMFLGELDTYQDEISFDDIIYSDRYGNNVKLKDVLLSEPGMEKEQVKKSYDNGQLKLLQQSMEYLNERNRRIISLYFGFVDDKRYSVFEIANIMAVSTTQIRKIIKDSLDKLKENIKLLENGMEVVKDNSCKKRLKTIYELLSDYTREEIDEMIDGVPEDDKELLRLRYGDDLDNPVSIMGYSKRLRYYTYLVNKMKRFLSNRDNTLKRSKIN